MRKSKKILSLILTFTLCLSLAAPVFATDSINDYTYQRDEIVRHKTEKLIESIAFEKEYYGFANVDIFSLWIGTPMCCYEVTEKGISPLTEIIFYPILDNKDNLISMVGAYNPADWCISMAPEIVNVLTDYILNNENNNIALIYDRTAVYCWDGESITCLLENKPESEVTNRVCISEIDETQFDNIQTQELKKANRLLVKSNPSVLGEGDSYAYVQVPIKRQPAGSNWCWAACLASIVQNEGKGTYTCTSMANHFGVTDKSVGKDAAFVEKALQQFNLTVDTKLNGYSNYLTDVLNSISYGHGVYGFFFTSTGAGHGMVIRGIDCDAGRFSVMDPESNTYRSGDIIGSPSNGSLSIAQSDNAVIFTAAGVMLVS